jgi:hypothetical protein
VRLVGAAYLLKDSITDDRITHLLLLPPALADTCLPNRMPDPQQVIYLDLSGRPIPFNQYFLRTAQSLPLAAAEGKLLLGGDTPPCFTLQEANIEWLSPMVPASRPSGRGSPEAAPADGR